MRKTEVEFVIASRTKEINRWRMTSSKSPTVLISIYRKESLYGGHTIAPVLDFKECLVFEWFGDIDRRIKLLDLVCRKREMIDVTASKWKE